MNVDLIVIGLIVGGVVVTLAVTAVAGRLQLSTPICLVAVGAVISFIPGIPRLTIQPDWVLFGVLPPLLYAAAMETSIVDTQARRDPIIVLSVVLVAYTVVVVGFVTWALVPTIPIAAGLALGAVVAPTDAVAVKAVTRKAPLPRVVATVLDGESLLNDATALAALNAALAAITAKVTAAQVAGGFALAVVGGVSIGLGVGWGLSVVRARVRAPVMDTSLSLVAPYLAFLPAAAIGASGILAVVIAGLVQSYRSPALQSARARIAEELNWRTIAFLLENGVFLVIGLSFAGILHAAVATGIPAVQMVLICIAVLVVMLVSRLLWGLLLTLVFQRGPRRLRRPDWHWQQTVVVSFAGVRGVVTLAAVFLLPESTPQRGFLQLLAFAVVLGTLLQTLMLPGLLRLLPSLRPPNTGQERAETQMLLAEAQKSGLQALGNGQEEHHPRIVQRLQTDAGFLAESLRASDHQAESLHEAYTRARRLTLDAERRAVLRARAERRYGEPAVRAALRVLDAEEIALETIGDAGTEGA